MTVLDVLIVNFNTADLLPEMFSACRAAKDTLHLRYWLVDNASQDDSANIIRKQFPDVHLEVNSENIGFGRANNQLLRHVTSDYALLLNTDAFVSPDTLRLTLNYMQDHPDCGVLGVKLLGRDGVLQPSCRYFPTPWNVFLSRTGLGKFFSATQMVDEMEWDNASVRECDWVPGCYYLVRRQVLDEVGLFDPRFFLYCEEVDHCRRVKAAGWKVMYFPHTTVVHIGGESAKTAGVLSGSGRQLSALQVESELLYFRKHHGLLGIAQHLFLAAAAASYLTLKDTLKHRKWGALRYQISELYLILRLLWRTRFGNHATR